MYRGSHPQWVLALQQATCSPPRPSRLSITAGSSNHRARQPVAPPRRIIEVSLVSRRSSGARSVVRPAEGLSTPATDHVLRERAGVRGPVFVDYGAEEPGDGAEAGRLFLHRQHLPGEMRVEMPQSAHHSHLRFLQALAGTKHVASAVCPHHHHHRRHHNKLLPFGA